MGAGPDALDSGYLSSQPNSMRLVVSVTCHEHAISDEKGSSGHTSTQASAPRAAVFHAAVAHHGLLVLMLRSARVHSARRVRAVAERTRFNANAPTNARSGPHCGHSLEQHQPHVSSYGEKG